MLHIKASNPADAAIICGWPQNETEFNWWSAGKIGPFPANPENLLRFYADPANQFCDLFSVFDDFELCGHFTLRYLNDANSALRLGFIILNPNCRRRGYAKEMLQFALRYAHEHYPGLPVSLGVFADNFSAMHCYQAIGFTFTGENEKTAFNSAYQIMRY